MVKKKKKPDTALYFTTVLAVNKDNAILGGHLYMEQSEPSITRVMLLESGQWFHLFDIDDVVYSAEIVKQKSDPSKLIVYFLGREGVFREVASGKDPVDNSLSIEDAGYLMDLRAVGDKLFVCGGQNIVYRRDKKRAWQRFDTGIFSPIGDTLDRSLESIDGFADNDIYAVGSNGQIQHWNGTVWTKMPGPTNLPLYKVLCAQSGKVYIGGSGGVFFEGNAAQGWRDLTDMDLCSGTIEDMAEFNGCIYLTTSDELFSFDGQRLRRVDVPVEGEKAYYTIDANSDVLWVAGDECVLRFDGHKWDMYPCTENF